MLFSEIEASLHGKLEATNVSFMVWLLRHDAIEVQSSTKSLIRAIPRVQKQSPLPRRGKYGKKKVRALRVSDDSDDRCFFSSFSSSDGSCLIVKKNTYTSVAWDKNLQLSILSSRIRLNLIFFVQLNRTWFLHQKDFCWRFSFDLCQAHDLGGLQQLCRGRSIWPAMMIEFWIHIEGEESSRSHLASKCLP